MIQKYLMFAIWLDPLERPESNLMDGISCQLVDPAYQLDISPACPSGLEIPFLMISRLILDGANSALIIITVTLSPPTGHGRASERTCGLRRPEQR